MSQGGGQRADAPGPGSVSLTCALSTSTQEATWADGSQESGAAARVLGARALQAAPPEVGPTSSGGKAGLALRHLLKLSLPWQLTAIAHKPRGLREGVLGVLLRAQRTERMGAASPVPLGASLQTSGRQRPSRGAPGARTGLHSPCLQSQADSRLPRLALLSPLTHLASTSAHVPKRGLACVTLRGSHK